MPTILFLVALFSTVFCTAVNAYTYQIAYPLWAVSGNGFPGIHREYMRRLDWIITVPHIVMFFSSASLIAFPPAWVQRSAALWLFGLVATVVAISAFVAGPIHTQFTRNGIVDTAGLTRLIRISLLRVILMIAACGILARSLLTGLA